MILKNHEDAKLEEVTAYLHGREIGICSLSTRIQAYDFTNQRASKRNSEKNAIPEYEEFINNTVLPSTKSKRVRALSEDRANLRNSTDRKLRALSLDDLHESKDYIIKRLILLLNDLFPDYDFALARPTQFALHSHQTCMQIINSHLAEVTLGDAQFLHKMWNAINDSINLSDCEILAYNPIDIGDGPFADGIWTFNYFFYNEQLKRLCFFFCKAEVIPIPEAGYDDDYDMSESESDSGGSSIDIDMDMEDSE